MSALVLFSHGSLLCGSGKMLDKHAAALRASGKFKAVEPGYLNYSTPPVEEAVKRCVASGASTIIIVPYFLVAGKFVTRDLPERLKQVVAEYPGIAFRLAEPLGVSDAMASAANQLLETAAAPDMWRNRAIVHAREVCELRTECPLYGSEMCKMAAAK